MDSRRAKSNAGELTMVGGGVVGGSVGVSVGAFVWATRGKL
jgi:hypothetical protein